MRLPSVGYGQLRQAFREDALDTVRIRTTETPCVDLQAYGQATPGEIGKSPDVGTSGSCRK